MAWSRPYRPKTDNGVTQPFTSGIVTIYSEQNVAPPGYLPQVQLIEKVTLRYEERSLGLQRYFNAQQNQVQVERVIRCPRYAGVRPGRSTALLYHGSEPLSKFLLPFFRSGSKIEAEEYGGGTIGH